jgi:hypothetical protein
MVFPVFDKLFWRAGNSGIRQEGGKETDPDPDAGKSRVSLYCSLSLDTYKMTVIRDGYHV